MPKIDLEPSAPAVEGQPFWQTDDGAVRFFLGDVTERLRELPSASVQLVVTSPPYWGLRDYGTGSWEGGGPNCDHVERCKEEAHRSSTLGPTAAERARGDLRRVLPAENSAFKATARQIAERCGKCGAKRIDMQIGAEPSPDCGTLGQAQCGRCFVCRMVGVFREVRRVLRDDGLLFLNLGDTYASGPRGNKEPGGGNLTNSNMEGKGCERSRFDGAQFDKREASGLPSGNLVGIPWRVALALQTDGWVLRSDIPWTKRSAMPESCDNRPCKALEYVFMFSKKPGYFFDMEAVRKRYADSRNGDPGDFQRGELPLQPSDGKPMATRVGLMKPTSTTGRAFRNADLWFESVDAPHGLCWLEDEMVGLDVTSEAYPGSHFATFPSGLIRPFILAGTSERGCCADCGAPWRRVVEFGIGYLDMKAQATAQGITPGNVGGTHRPGRRGESYVAAATKELGWEPSCCCRGWREDRIVKVRRPVSLERADEAAVERGGPKGSGGNRNDDDRGTALGVRDRSLPQNRNGITGSLDGAPRQEEWTLEQRRAYVSRLPLEDHPVVPCTVLDPFVGSGTTALVCLKLGRRCVGIDLSEQYLMEHAVRRVKVFLTNSAPLRVEPSGAAPQGDLL